MKVKNRGLSAQNLCKWKPTEAPVKVSGTFYLEEVLSASRSDSGSVLIPDSKTGAEDIGRGSSQNRIRTEGKKIQRFSKYKTSHSLKELCFN